MWFDVTLLFHTAQVLVQQQITKYCCGQIQAWASTDGHFL